ncbi:hypothetical protein AB0I61_02500 [Polymorphospora rubra]|uniref:hypothetical protein n=1 Tax=Polymorphospora rubra TaxID=338584 RepID=UPI0033F64DEE
MRRLASVSTIALCVTLTACGQNPGGPGDPAPVQDGFAERAAAVAETWRARPADAWHTGYLPLQNATVLPGNPKLDADAEMAFNAGWYVLKATLPADAPSEGVVRFADGELPTALVGAAEAYRELDQGDPPACPPPGGAQPTPTGGPDGTASSAAPCGVLTVTGVELGEVAVLTSRGEARVPAWLFQVTELPVPVARVAVAPADTAALPQVAEPTGAPPAGLVTVQDLSDVDGSQITFRLGIGACDTDPRPFVEEFDDVVVVSGTVTRPTAGECTDQLLFEPVAVTLAAPLGDRPVLDAVSGQPMRLPMFR